MLGLTQAQNDVLKFIKVYTKVYGYSPSYAEIAQGTGRISKANVMRLLNELEERGYIVKSPKWRSIKVLT